MPADIEHLRPHLHDFDFQRLSVGGLGWSHDMTEQVSVHAADQECSLEQVTEETVFVVYQCDCAASSDIPAHPIRLRNGQGMPTTTCPREARTGVNAVSGRTSRKSEKAANRPTPLSDASPARPTRVPHAASGGGQDGGPRRSSHPASLGTPPSNSRWTIGGTRGVSAAAPAGRHRR